MIIQFLVALACVLFVVSLPIAKTPLGGALRRWAAFTFLVALVPSACFGLFREAARSRLPWTPGRIAGELFTLFVVALIAYAALSLRKWLRAEPQKPRRLATKQAVEPPGARPDLFSMLRDQLRSDDEFRDGE